MDQVTEVIAFYGYVSSPGDPTEKDDWQALYCKKQGLENPWDYFHGGDVERFKNKFKRQIDAFFEKYYEAAELYPVTHRIYGGMEAKRYGEIYAITDSLKVSSEWLMLQPEEMVKVNYIEATKLLNEWWVATGVSLDGFEGPGWFAVVDTY